MAAYTRNAHGIAVARKLASAVSVLTLSLTIATRATAAPLPPFNDPPDGAGHLALTTLLETRLQSMSASCVGGDLLNGSIYVLKGGAFGKKKVPVTAVPDFIRNNLFQLPGVAKYVSPQFGMSLTREFGYIYSDTEKTAKSDPSPGLPLGFIDGVDYSNVSDTLTSPGINATTFDTNCTNVFSSAVDLSGNYALPIAAVKGGLDASYSTSASYALSIVTGRFESPIVGTLTKASALGPTNPFGRSVLALQLWDWYNNNPERTSEKNWLLWYFDGIALYKQATLKRNTNFSANLSASVGLPGLVNFSTTDSLALSQETRANAQSFETDTYVDQNGVRRDYYLVPAPVQLANIINQSASAGPDPSNPGDQVIIAAQSPLKFNVSAYGIPQSDCQSVNWNVSGASVTVLQKASQKDSNNMPYCAFALGYTPTQNDYSNGVTLGITIDTPPLPNAAHDVAHIKVSPISFTPTTNPQLQSPGGNAPIAFTPPAAGQNGPFFLTWNVSLRLSYDSDRAVSDPSTVDLNSVYIDCTPDKYYPVINGVSLSTAAGNSRTLTFSLSYSYPGNQSALAASGGTRTCTLGGPVTYSLAHGRISRTLPTLLITWPARTTAG
jgi:hypothetical protein